MQANGVSATFFGKCLKLLVREFGNRPHNWETYERMRQLMAELEAAYKSDQEGGDE